MRWRRSCQHFGGYLALFALALQLAVSFAHIHLESFGPSSAIADVASFAGLSAEAPDSSAAPSDRHGGGVPHHDCAICISLGLLGNGLNGQPPVLSAPAVLRAAPLRPVSEFNFSLARYISFRTRAPPAV